MQSLRALSKSNPRLRLVADSGQLAELGPRVESHRWLIDGRPVALVIWPELGPSGRPAGDARWSETVHAWLALRAV